jgi:hypothetical protein
LVVLLTSGFAWVAWTVSAINWFALGASCWWSWDNLSGGAHRSLMNRGRIEAPIELTEMLLPPIQFDSHDSEGTAQ